MATDPAPVTREEVAVLFGWPADSLGGYVVIGVPAAGTGGVPKVATDTADLTQVICALAYVIGSIAGGGAQIAYPSQR